VILGPDFHTNEVVECDNLTTDPKEGERVVERKKKQKKTRDHIHITVKDR
jgi:hypothetical protein